MSRVSFKLEGLSRTAYIYPSTFNSETGFETRNVPIDVDRDRLNVHRHELEVPIAAAIAKEMQDEDFFGPRGPVTELLRKKIDCVDLAKRADEDRGGEGIWETAFLTSCRLAIVEYAKEIQDVLIEDGNSIMEITGSGKIVDTNKDKRPDRLTDGIWVGEILQSEENISLAGSTFTASRY